MIEDEIPLAELNHPDVLVRRRAVAAYSRQAEEALFAIDEKALIARKTLLPSSY